VDKDEVIKFLNLLGAENITDADDWIRASCPLASKWHMSGTDEKPSFGIKIRPSGESFYHCFSCGSGTLHSLLSKLTWTHLDVEKAASFCALKEVFPNHTPNDAVMVEYKDPFTSCISNSTSKCLPVPEDVLSLFPLLMESNGYESKRCMQWFEGRGITKEVVQKYNVRIDKEHQAIIFPILDSDGRTYKLHARARIDKTFYHVTPKLLSLNGFWGRKDSWFGMQFYSPDKTIFLVESETDAMKLASFGVNNVLASCGGISKLKMRRILNCNVVLGFDADGPGRAYRTKAIRFLDEGTKITTLDWSVLNKEKKKKKKDAGDLKSFEEFVHVWSQRNVFVKGGGAGEVRKDVGYKDVFDNAM
jgi:hypothetical protein